MYASASYGGGNAWMKIMGIGDQGGKRKKDKEKNGSTARQVSNIIHFTAKIENI